ncbi:RGCVC family protein [Kibdelosporangium lantanae]|uniref:RGCVC family protein n=1 Tax=Kibdelosporangium lantanae TaxID=1497396 RepID=A0ABW3MCU1_9PSEU
MTTQPADDNGLAVRASTVDIGPEMDCATCPHPWGGHDPIAVRYCIATATRGYDRGCVCADKETS